MNKVDIEKLMELYKQIDQTEWYMPKAYYNKVNDEHGCLQLETVRVPDNGLENVKIPYCYLLGEFITQIHNSFPAIVEELRVMRKENELLLQYFKERCPFIRDEETCSSKSCGNCITLNINQKALSELEKEDANGH